MQRAGIMRRFASLTYESLLLVALVFIASFLIAPLVSPASALRDSLVVPSTLGRAISFLALFSLLASYFVFGTSLGRRTLPMKTWRLRLVTTSGETISRKTALLRYLAAWIGPALAVAAFGLLKPIGLGAIAWPLVALNWLAPLVDPDRQFLHDRIAGTRLVID
ncbi:MAG TPA: RDD family protein [Casimicrobiaceae bacterium]|nr:RDD family protein [Casimicrobiaceae bacterium]